MSTGRRGQWPSIKQVEKSRDPLNTEHSSLSIHEEHRSAIIIAASSGIGNALSRRWLARGWKLCGTFRTQSTQVEELLRFGMRLVSCDLDNVASIREACSSLRELCPQWDALVLCPGSLEPLAAFADCPFDEWERSVRVNLISQMRILHDLLPSRRSDSPLGPCALFFAGGGTNDAPVNSSAYTVSKIALIKMCELLDAEIPDTRFVIVGPGWVRTKIHEATVAAGPRAGPAYQRTIDRLATDEFTPMDRVLECCDWLIDAPRPVIGGRNFSVVYDRWGDGELARKLVDHPDMYKLRRQGNDPQ
jgi:NAD(P)-dependent dehydrogenase (short-subunit alcohol dehydrogenase family)